MADTWSWRGGSSLRASALVPLATRNRKLPQTGLHNEYTRMDVQQEESPRHGSAVSPKTHCASVMPPPRGPPRLPLGLPRQSQPPARPPPPLPAHSTFVAVPGVTAGTTASRHGNGASLSRCLFRVQKSFQKLLADFPAGLTGQSWLTCPLLNQSLGVGVLRFTWSTCWPRAGASFPWRPWRVEESRCLNKVGVLGRKKWKEMEVM